MSKPKTKENTFTFNLKDDFFHCCEQRPVVCAAGIKKIFGVDSEDIRIVGSLTKPRGKGWLCVKAYSESETIMVGRKMFEMHYDLEAFLTRLGVVGKRFYVRLSAIAAALLLAGCAGLDAPDVREVSVDGCRYRLLEPARTLSNGTTRVELWERVEPIDDKHLYTPTLSSQYTGFVSFTPLAK